MAILKVAHLGHPVLRREADPVAVDRIRSPGLQRLVDDMIETMREYSAVGLAAPQVHVLLQLFVAEVEADSQDHGTASLPLTVLFNPGVEPLAGALEEDWEGCLSIPGLRGKVPRAPRVRVAGYDRQGKRVEFSAAGLPARVMQHEHDHLRGAVFLDRMIDFSTLTFLEEYARYWIHAGNAG